MHRYIDNQEVIEAKKPWTHKDTGASYCRRFLESATEEELEAVGVEFVADPEPTAPNPQTIILNELRHTDQQLVTTAARMLEDIVDERVAEGKYVSDAVKSLVADRKALRAQL